MLARFALTLTLSLLPAAAEGDCVGGYVVSKQVYRREATADVFFGDRYLLTLSESYPWDDADDEAEQVIIAVTWREYEDAWVGGWWSRP